jgi:hypothetical protein
MLHLDSLIIAHTAHSALFAELGHTARFDMFAQLADSADTAQFAGCITDNPKMGSSDGHNVVCCVHAVVCTRGCCLYACRYHTALVAMQFQGVCTTGIEGVLMLTVMGCVAAQLDCYSAA